MSNYRTGYFDVLQAGRYLTPKQRRRMHKKSKRDLIAVTSANTHATRSGNANPPASLSGHPGRRRAQLAERADRAVEREYARALRRAERERA